MASRMYLGFGFIPCILSPDQYDSWFELSQRLGWQLNLPHPETMNP